MIKELGQQNLNIDLFFVSGNHIGFVASGAGNLSKSVTVLDKKIEMISLFFRNLPEVSEVSIIKIWHQ